MSNAYIIPIQLLKFLGSCLFGDPVAYYNALNVAERIELEEQRIQFGMTGWFYYYLYDILPQAEKKEFQNFYLTRKAQAFFEERELKRIYNILNRNGLRFVPIKGADLTYRLYLDTALRIFNDWDFWFHPDDCDHALKVLKEDGWEIPASCSQDHNAVRKNMSQHFSVHVRGNCRLEPHFTLPMFEHVDPHEMWDYTEDFPGGDGQRILSPEMNLLMLTRHATSDSYFHARLPKLLTDTAVILLNNKIDFTKLHNMTEHWQMPYPCDLLAAFYEFFPPETIRKFQANSLNAKKFRNLFEFRAEYEAKPSKVAISLCQYKVRGKLAQSLLQTIKKCTPNRIRLIYRLPKHGAWTKVALAYISWFWTRSWRAVFSIGISSKLQKYTRMVEDVESLGLVIIPESDGNRYA